MGDNASYYAPFDRFDIDDIQIHMREWVSVWVRLWLEYLERSLSMSYQTYGIYRNKDSFVRRKVSVQIDTKVMSMDHRLTSKLCDMNYSFLPPWIGTLDLASIIMLMSVYQIGGLKY